MVTGMWLLHSWSCVLGTWVLHSWSRGMVCGFCIRGSCGTACGGFCIRGSCVWACGALAFAGDRYRKDLTVVVGSPVAKGGAEKPSRQLIRWMSLPCRRYPGCPPYRLDCYEGGYSAGYLAGTAEGQEEKPAPPKKVQAKNPAPPKKVEAKLRRLKRCRRRNLYRLKSSRPTPPSRSRKSRSPWLADCRRRASSGGGRGCRRSARQSVR